MPIWQKRWLYRFLVLVIVVGLIAFLRVQLQESDPRMDRLGQRVRLIDPPPPPPPKKIEEKPPEAVVRQEVKIEKAEPDEGDDKPAVDDRLGLDAEGGDGADGFGLAAKKGGKDLLTTARIGGGDGVRGFGLYAAQIERFLQRVLSKDQDLRKSSYTATVSLWLDSMGHLDRYQLTRSSGDPTIDAHLSQILAGLEDLGLPPPHDLPQPVRLRISSRLTD